MTHKTLSYAIAKELKDAGFPQELGRPFIDPEGKVAVGPWDSNWAMVPSLEELIAACGEEFCGLSAPTQIETHWRAFDRNRGEYGHGTTPTEAVACLWLALNKPNTTRAASS